MALYIVRHAWAADRDESRWPDDDQRPLTREGKERFARMATRLVERGVSPEIIITSPLVRCVQTAAILADALGKKIEPIERDELRPGGDLGRLLAWTAGELQSPGTGPFFGEQARFSEKRLAENMDLSPSRHEIAWVGHAPEVGLWTAALVGDESAAIRFAKGAAAAIEFDGPPTLGAGELQWLVTAKIVGE